MMESIYLYGLSCFTLGGIIYFGTESYRAYRRSQRARAAVRRVMGR